MGRIVGGIEINRDAAGTTVQPAAVALDHLLGQRLGHPVEMLAARSVLEAAQRRLGSQIGALDGVAPHQHLVYRVGSQPGGVVGVGIAAGDAIDALRQQLFHRVLDLARLPRVGQASRQRLGQSQTPISGFQKDGAAVGTPLPLVKPRDHRLGKDFGKQQTLCRGIVAQAKASLWSEKPRAQRFFTMRRLFVFKEFENYSG